MATSALFLGGALICWEPFGDEVLHRRIKRFQLGSKGFLPVEDCGAWLAERGAFVYSWGQSLMCNCERVQRGKVFTGSQSDLDDFVVQLVGSGEGFVSVKGDV